jgi:hypothetical protein
MREAIMKGQTDFAEGGYVQGYADGGSASGSASNSLADLYEKYHAEPTTQPPPTYEEMANNPVGWSTVYPPQYMSNQDPNVSKVPTFSNVTLPGASRPLTYAELEAARSGSINLFDSLGNITSGGRSPPRRMAASVRKRDGLPPAPLRPGAGAAEPVGIRAFHGSPHKFDQFDMSKIGTGEGAQAYGHGLYFAGNEGVARSYRDKLSGSNRALSDLTKDGELMFKSALDDHYKTLASQYGVSARQARAIDGSGGAAHDAVLRGLPETAFSPGSMYEVNLRTNPERLLDWDKPITQQSPQVQNFVREQSQGGGLSGVIERFLTNRGLLYGADILNAYKSPFYKPAAFSEAAKNAGIDGVRYLDRSSRAAGQGSSNYVMFDDKLIALLRRYGLLGMVGGGAAAAGGKQAPTEEQADYAQGGSVNSAPVYDPAVIAAIAASITEDDHA